MLGFASAQDVANLITNSQCFEALDEALDVAATEMGFQFHALMRHPRAIESRMSPMRIPNYGAWTPKQG